MNGTGRPPEGTVQTALMRRSASTAAVMDAVCGGRAGLSQARLAADRMAEVSPLLVAGLRAGRAFVHRAVVQAAEAGVTQFVQVGCGFPGVRMVHEVAGRGRRGVRTVYADEDPAPVGVFDMLTMGDATVTAVVGDVRRPGTLLNMDRVRSVIDPARPVCLILGGSLAHLTDVEDPSGVLADWRARLAPGSWLVVSHPVPGEAGPEADAAWEAAELFEAITGAPLVLRSPEAFAGLLTGLEVQAPGLLPVNAWRPSLLRGQPVPMLGAITLRPAPMKG